jgi:hypothetical protein
LRWTLTLDYQLPERVAISNEIDRGDAIVGYGKAECDAQLAFMHPNGSGLAIDEYRLRRARTSEECPCNCVRAFDTGL